MIRAATLGAPRQFKNKIVDVCGVSVEVRQCTVGEREEMVKRARVETVEGGEKSFQTDLAQFRRQAVIACCYVPGTDEKVFTPEDADALAGDVTRGYYDTLADQAMELLNVVADEKRAEKN